MGTRHLYWIVTGPSFAVHSRNPCTDSSFFPKRSTQIFTVIDWMTEKFPKLDPLS